MAETKHAYIELYNYTQSWRDLPQNERSSFTKAVDSAIEEMRKNGADVLGFGFNEHATDRRAPYDFFCIYTLPSSDFARSFEQQVEASGWYGYFEQKNLSGPLETPATILGHNVMLDGPEGIA
ncbi:DUF6616 family protein [uncultured Roseobacter sp.]|uniref:DUF6616 family protein n=1 Tax=uncultured Roseobacter sp. TaxID=114847 RepID=UPI002619F33E|nr:DUF6616 family protein [uncultured Roseobacter sp.]